MSSTVSARRVFRDTVVGRRERRRLVTALAHERDRGNQRHQHLMNRRGIQPQLQQQQQQQSRVATTTSNAGGNAGPKSRKEMLDKFKRDKELQRVIERGRKLACPPFRAGCPSACFSVFDHSANRAVKTALGARGKTPAVRPPGTSYAPVVYHGRMTRSRTAAARVDVGTVPLAVPTPVSASVVEKSAPGAADPEEEASSSVQPAFIVPKGAGKFQPPAGLPTFDFSWRKTAASTEPPRAVSPSPSLHVQQDRIEPVCSRPEVVSSNCSDATSTDQLSVHYFRELVRKSDERLNAAADFWDCGSLGVPERMEGEVRSVQGQVRLLIRERFGQFLGLVDQCERQIGPKPTTLFDLQGFWEMVLLQVDDVDCKLNKLHQMRQSGWTSSKSPAVKPQAQASGPARAKTATAPKARKPRPAANSGLRAFIAASRKRMETVTADDDAPLSAPAVLTSDQVNKTSLTSDLSRPRSPSVLSCCQAVQQLSVTPVKQFSGGFFTIESPPVSEQVISASVKRCRDADNRRSSLKLQQKQFTHTSFTPQHHQRRPLCDLSPLMNVCRSAKQASQAAVPSPLTHSAVPLSPLVASLQQSHHGVSCSDTFPQSAGRPRRSSRPLAYLMAMDSPIAAPPAELTPRRSTRKSRLV